MKSKSTQELEAEVSRFESFAHWGGLLIIFALLFEVVAPFVPHVSDIPLAWQGRIANGLIAFGVWAEIHFGGMASRNQKELLRRSNDRLAGAENRAAEAQEELRRYRAPRNDRLTPEARQLIVDRLKPFSRTRFDTGLVGGAGEPMHFLWQLDEVLRNAGWNHVDWQGEGLQTTSGSRLGGRFWINGTVWADDVEIHIQPPYDAATALRPAGDALIAALNDIGVAARFAGFNTHSINAAAIHILIGLKQ